MVDGRLQLGHGRAGCPFCAIVAGAADADIVLDVDAAVAFLDRSPLFKGHVLVVPRAHVVTLPELDQVGPFFEAVQLVSNALPTALAAQGTFVAMNNIVSPKRAALPRPCRPRTRGDGLRGFCRPCRNTHRARPLPTLLASVPNSLESIRCKCNE